jgi:hypothetical protein
VTQYWYNKYDSFGVDPSDKRLISPIILQTMESTSTEHPVPLARKKYPGILSLIMCDTSPLLFYPFHQKSLDYSTSIMRRNKHHLLSRDQDNLCSNPMGIEPITPNSADTIVYDPELTEWSLLFVASSKNLNTLRFRPILVKFCNENSTKVQCICISNDNTYTCNDDDNYLKNSDRGSHRRSNLLCGTGFFELTWDHPNRDIILHLMGVTKVPTVVVISNHNGIRRTDRGMEDIELGIDIDDLLERWRNPSSFWNMSNCLVS